MTPVRAADKVVEIVTKCHDINDAQVQRLVLEACLTAATSSVCDIHRESLLETVYAADNVMLGNHVENSNTARVVVRKLVRHVFTRYERLSEQAAAAVGTLDSLSVMAPPNLPNLANLVADWYEAMKERPTAIVLPTDMLAIYFMREMTRRGYHLPEDLSVTGCDNIPFTEVVTPTLTSFGERADDSLSDCLVACLLHRMANPDAPRMIYRVKRRLIVRESTAPPKKNQKNH